jgi:hypothetical protein
VGQFPVTGLYGHVDLKHYEGVKKSKKCVTSYIAMI